MGDGLRAAAPPAKAPDPETDAAVLARHVDNLVEPATVAAYEDLDEGRIAIRIATSWLRGKMAGPANRQATAC